MTKEKLKKEAEEKGREWERSVLPKREEDYTPYAPHYPYSQGYIAGVESREKRIAELEAQISNLKAIGKTSYIKGIRTMANALKDYDRTDGAWTDYFEHTVDKVLKKLLKGEL